MTMNRIFAVFASLLLGGALVAWLVMRQRRQEIALLTQAKAQSDRLALLVASSMAINAASLTQLSGNARAEAGPIEEVALPVNIAAAPALNDVPFAWNGRKLLDYRFLNGSGEEQTGLELTPTDGGFTVISNEAFSGTVYLFLFA